MTAITPCATLLAQLTDPHIRAPGERAYGLVDTAAHLREAVATVLRLPQRPDAVVLTGDLTDFGQPAEYDHLARLLAPLRDAGLPLHLLPGNHDERTALRVACTRHAGLNAGADADAAMPGDCIQYSVAVGGLQLIALDTVRPGASHGELCAARLDWLANELQRQPRRPTVIAMHHPPFDSGIGHMDAIGLRQGRRELEALVARHPQVQRVICGHLHRAIAVRFGGSIASSASSTAHQVCLDLSPTAPSAWTREPPGLALHELPANGPLRSHGVPSGRFDGPHPFFDASGQLLR